MLKRILWDITAFALVLIAPWWATLGFTAIGCVLFPWYLEGIFVGALYDVLFGGGVTHWYQHLVHTGIFAIPVLVMEYVKTKIHL